MLDLSKFYHFTFLSTITTAIPHLCDSRKVQNAKEICSLSRKKRLQISKMDKNSCKVIFDNTP